jgi:hypothetical protein
MRRVRELMCYTGSRIGSGKLDDATIQKTTMLTQIAVKAPKTHRVVSNKRVYFNGIYILFYVTCQCFINELLMDKLEFEFHIIF